MVSIDRGKFDLGQIVFYLKLVNWNLREIILAGAIQHPIGFSITFTALLIPVKLFGGFSRLSELLSTDWSFIINIISHCLAWLVFLLIL